jgi:hypothetical protein
MLFLYGIKETPPGYRKIRLLWRIFDAQESPLPINNVRKADLYSGAGIRPGILLFPSQAQTKQIKPNPPNQTQRFNQAH